MEKTTSTPRHPGRPKGSKNKKQKELKKEKISKKDNSYTLKATGVRVFRFRKSDKEGIKNPRKGKKPVDPVKSAMSKQLLLEPAVEWCVAHGFSIFNMVDRALKYGKEKVIHACRKMVKTNQSTWRWCKERISALRYQFYALVDPIKQDTPMTFADGTGYTEEQLGEILHLQEKIHRLKKQNDFTSQKLRKEAIATLRQLYPEHCPHLLWSET